MAGKGTAEGDNEAVQTTNHSHSPAGSNSNVKVNGDSGSHGTPQGHSDVEDRNSDKNSPKSGSKTSLHSLSNGGDKIANSDTNKSPKSDKTNGDIAPKSNNPNGDIAPIGPNGDIATNDDETHRTSAEITGEGATLLHKDHLHEDDTDLRASRLALDSTAVLQSIEDLTKLPHHEEDGDSGCCSCCLPQNRAKCRMRVYVTVACIVVTNLLNHADRFTIAGVLMKIQKFFVISNAQAGLLQTAFMVAYMIFSPLFGYLGDRYNRRLLMAAGVFTWSTANLVSSFAPAGMYWTLLLGRAIAGIGKACFTTIAPSILADLFVGKGRTRVLTCYYFALPVGSGLGYVIGSSAADALGGWMWALRVTPAVGFACLLLIIFVVREPTRGEAEGGQNISTTSFKKDIIYLLKNKSFMFSTLGFTFSSSVAVATAVWGPTFVAYALQIQHLPVSEVQIGLIFGVIICLGGMVGVPTGSLVATWWHKRNPRSHALVCALGLMLAVGTKYLVITIAQYSINTMWVFTFISVTLVALNFVLVTDILMAIVVPTRRATAYGLQIIMGHALGDAFSPFMVGAVSDAIALKFSWPETSAVIKFVSMKYALYVTCFMTVIGAFCFFFTGVFVEQDTEAVNIAVKEAALAKEKREEEERLNGTKEEDKLSHNSLPAEVELQDMSPNKEQPVDSVC